jgi:hypothetical protein
MNQFRERKSRADRRCRIRGFRAFSYVRERFPHQSGCDAKALGDERLEYGLECGQDSRLARLNEDAERSPHHEATLLCHLAACTLVDEKEIGPEQFGDQDSCRLAWIEPEV